MFVITFFFPDSLLTVSSNFPVVQMQYKIYAKQHELYLLVFISTCINGIKFYESYICCFDFVRIIFN